MSSLRILLATLGVAILLSGCSLNKVFETRESEAAPAATTSSAAGAAPKAGTVSSASRAKVTKKAAKALGAEVMLKPGAFLLCNTVDRYKERTTTYYVCRERGCVGQETPAEVKAPNTKSGCLSACRKREAGSRRDSNVRAYCVN